MAPMKLHLDRSLRGVHPTAFIAPNATIIGDVTIGRHSSVWYGAVIRADTTPVTIGDETNIQEGCILHADPGYPARIGDRVTLGHGAIVHGATIEDDVLVGIRAVVLNGAKVGRGSIVGAGAVVTEGTIIPPNSLVLGVPAKAVKEVTPEQAKRIRESAISYVEYAKQHKEDARRQMPDAGPPLDAGFHPTPNIQHLTSGLGSEDALRSALIEVGRRLYERGLVVAAEGNVSVRLDDRRLLTTPTGACKGVLTPDQLVLVDLEGRRLQGELLPSSELPLHLAIYRARSDVQAIVHAHPPIATGFAVAGIPLDQPILAEAVVLLGPVPVAPYGTPTTEELSEAVLTYIRGHTAILLANHGALTVGGDLWEAYFRMEILERVAQVSLVAHLLGRRNVLSEEEIRKLSTLFGLRAGAGGDRQGGPDEDLLGYGQRQGD